jgi:chaperone modulatory protein CbpM
MKDIVKIISGTVLDENIEVSFKELCRMCQVGPEIVMEMIDEGIIEPRGEVKGNWRFRGYEIHRLQVTLRLKQDLRVNTPGAALVLDLLEEIERLRRVAGLK